MATVLSTQKASVLEELGDPNGVRFANATRVLLVTSFAARHFAFHTRCSPMQYSLTLSSGTQEYAIGNENTRAAGVRSVRLVMSSSYELNLPLVEPYGSGSYSFQSGTPSSAWARYYLGALKVGFMPIPNATMTAKVLGFVIPELSSTTSYTTTIPDEFALEPRFLAACILAFGKQDYQQAARSWEKYRESLKRTKFAMAQSGDMPYCSTVSGGVG